MRVEGCKHELTNNNQGMYICKKCGVSLEKDVQDEKDLQEIIDKNIKLFNDLRAPIMEDEICIIQERKCFGCNDGIDKEELFCSHCRREN